MINWKEAARHFRRMCQLYEGSAHPKCEACETYAPSFDVGENIAAGWSFDGDDDVWLCPKCVSYSASMDQKVGA